MRIKTSICLFILALSPALFAGTDKPESALERSLSSDGAMVAFSNIKDGDVLPPEFSVSFQISGMGIAPAGTKIENTGHHHLLVDLAEMPDFNQPLPANDQVRHFGKGQTETRLTLAEGKHTLQLLLADYRHVPHDPPVMSDVITITVSASAPPQAEE
jgi:hypothetical protein